METGQQFNIAMSALSLLYNNCKSPIARAAIGKALENVKSAKMHEQNAT